MQISCTSWKKIQVVISCSMPMSTILIISTYEPEHENGCAMTQTGAQTRMLAGTRTRPRTGTQTETWTRTKTLFRYHEDGSKKLNACNQFFLRMVYFKPEHKISLFTDHILQYLHTRYGFRQPSPLLLIACSIYLPPFIPVTRFFIYLENQLFCSWCEYPSTLVPGLLLLPP
jgi:hypothetical protein